MDAKEHREKRKSIRQQIQDQMQQELDRRKKEIKSSIKKENLSLQEKRRKYRREVHKEKLALMQLAKDEFRARKRMLGDTPSLDEPPPLPPQEFPDLPEPPDDLPEPPDDLPEPPENIPDEDARPHGSESPYRRSPGIEQEAFMYEDSEDSNAKEYGGPIGASDLLPAGMKEDEVPAQELPAGKEISFPEDSKSIFYYIYNLVLHPVQTLDEFDDYLTAPRGLVKVALFYVVSLLLVVVFALVSEEILSRLPSGLLWQAIGESMAANVDIAFLVGRTLLALLFYTGTIAIVNYFFAGEANFLTLLIYFGFVESVTRVIVYSLLILTVLAAIMAAVAPQVLVAVAVLFLVFFIWRVCLNIIVLISAYGYDWYTAILVAFGASILQDIILAIVVAEFGNIFLL